MQFWRDFLLGNFQQEIRLVETTTDFMLTVQELKLKLGAKADGLTDDVIETMRDQLYVIAGLMFEHWRKSNSSTKGEESSSSFVGEVPTSPQLHAGDSADVN